MYELPYGNTQQLNLDWFIQRWKEFYEEWEQTKTEIDGALDEEVQKVEDAMEDLYAARDAAAASATAAAASATSASNDATIAANAATAAAASATLANTKATAAGLSEAAAALSASQAANDATAAATSASQASASASSATDSAQAAATSEQNIESIIEDAIQDATDAAVAEATADAEAAATAAESSASDAADSATAAAASATAADSSADDAADSATAAAASATAAAGSASNAADSATAAAASAASIVIDSAMSNSSTNPVQNKVINGELTQLKTAVTQIRAKENYPLPFTYTANRMISAETGEISTQNTYRATNFIDISEFGYIKYARLKRTGNTASMGLAFYDSTQTFISGSGERPITKCEEAGVVDCITKVPSGAKYVRLTFNNASADSFYVQGIYKINEPEQKPDAFSYVNRVFNTIAYSVISDDDNDGAINSVEHFEYIGKKSEYTTIKGDVRPTSDGKLVMCHDEGFTIGEQTGKITTYDPNNCIVIHDKTLAELLELRYFKKFDGEDCHVCDCDTYFKICKKYGKTAFVTIRSEYVPAVLAALFPIIDKYDMHDHTIINSLDINSIRAARAYDSTIMCNWVKDSGSQINVNDVENIEFIKDCAISIFTFPNGGGLTTIDACIEFVQLANSKKIPVYTAIIYEDGAEVIDELLARGITGAQFSTPPVASA